VDPSALIFVALAVAWAVYLIPKALEHHEESARTRTVEAFSKGMRVLARREAVSRREAKLVKTAPSGEPTTAPAAAQKPAVRRTAAALAARRRLRVVTLILAANAIVVGMAGLSVFAWVWCAVPVGVLVAWLVACRVMVKRERKARPAVRRTPVAEAPAPAPEPPARRIVVDAETGEISVVLDEPATVDPPTKDPESWDPVPVTLPTYVSKPVARRSVRTIDLDSTGVWSSGRNESDSALAREAEAAEAAEKATQAETADEERRSS
jgi:hypothetical protein